MAEVVCVSKSNARNLKWVPKVKTIVNGIDLNEFKPRKKEPERFFRKLEMPLKLTEKTLLVGVIARLYKDKGVDYFIRAVEYISEETKVEDVYFLVVGEGPELSRLMNLAENLKVSKRVKFLGFLSRARVIHFLATVDIMVLPSSLHDPFGLTAAEAMAMKKPVVVTTVCGVAENLINQKSGIMVSPRDYTELAQAIFNLLINQQKRAEMGEEGYQVAQVKFNLERMVNEYEKLMGVEKEEETGMMPEAAPVEVTS